jgi:serine/threonine protein kinase
MTRELAPGARVDRYEMVCPIGEGGMATVWVARLHGKHGFQKLVAFKSILTRYAEDAHFRAMMLDEARIASHIEHPNVCQILDVGEADELLYLVLEYVDGEALSLIHYDMASRGVPFPLALALRIAEETCAGLHAAHELTDAGGSALGVVHRDVSPQNILLSVRGDVKIIDFGIALARDRMSEETSHGSLKGKVNYMPPEQAEAKKVDRTADVWSVGAMLYKLLAGRAPFQGPSDAATLTRLLSGTPPEPLPPEVPASVSDVVLRALAHSPAARFATALDLQRALEAARRGLGVDVSRDDLATFVRDNLPEKSRRRRSQLKEVVHELSPDSPGSGRQEMSLPSRILEKGDVPIEMSLSAVGGVLEPSHGSIPEVSLSSVGGVVEKTQAAAVAPPAPRPTPPPMRAIELDHTPPSGPGSAPEPPAEPRAQGGPAFMDVRALIRSEGEPAPDRAASAGGPRGPIVISAAPALTALPEDDNGIRPQIELAATPKNWKRTEEKKKVRWKPPVAFAAIALAVVALVVLGLPELARRRIVVAAAERGVELTIGKASLTTRGVELSDIRIRFPNVAGLQGTVREFRTDLAGETLTVTDLDLVADAPSDELLRDLESFKQRTGASSSLKRVQLQGLHVSWKAPPAPLTMVEMSQGSFELGTRATFGDDMRGSFQKVTLSSSEGTVGPWALYIDQDRELRRFRVVLDPPVPDGPHVTYSTGSSVDHVSAKIARSPLSRFGIPPKLVGIDGPDSPEVEADLDGTYKPAQKRLDLDLKLGVYGLRSGKGPVDFKAQVSFGGDPEKPVPMTKGSAELGAFTAELGGTLTLQGAGARVDASFRTTSMTCERLARLQSEKTLGSFGGWFVDVMRTSGLAAVTGSLDVQGAVAFDTKAPRATRVTWLTKETCGLKLFRVGAP